MRERLARYPHRAAPKPGETWREVRRTRRRRARRTVLILEVDATHARVRNTHTGWVSWIKLTEFTHGITRGWRRLLDAHEVTDDR